MNFRFVNFLCGIFAATLLGSIEIGAAEMEMLPNNLIRVDLGATSSQRIAVDVSSNLVNWAQLMNVPAGAGKVSFVNDPTLADPGRFFRLADGDETFAVAGYVDGGEFFGGVAGATITALPGGQTAKSDANGFFHFDQRFGREALPLTLSLIADFFPPQYRTINASDAGSLTVFNLFTGQPSWPSALAGAASSTFRFRVTSGPRAGLEYSLVFTNNEFSLQGGLSGRGSREFGTSPERLQLRFDSNPTKPTDIYFFLGLNSLQGRFAGIPSTNGTLSGNGVVTIEITPPVFGPATLSGKAYVLGFGADQIQFGENDNSYTFLSNGSNETGTYSAVRSGSDWNITLLNAAMTSTSALTLKFTSNENGTYDLQRPAVSGVTGAFQAVFPSGGAFTAPAALATVRVTIDVSPLATSQLTINLSGGTTGTFVITDGGSGSGVYTYSPNGTSARLRLDYMGEFSGDFDDMTLYFKAGPGSATQSAFSGTMRVSGSDSPYLGKFTY